MQTAYQMTDIPRSKSTGIPLSHIDAYTNAPPGRIILNKVIGPEYSLAFNKPYVARVKRTGYRYSFEDVRLSMFVYGDSVSDIKAELTGEFLFMWDCIVCESDDNLTNDAKIIKYWLLDNIVKESE